MTEEEWLTATDPMPMLKRWNGMASDSRRKCKLFVTSCCRIARLGANVQEVLDSAERYADGIADEAELEVAWSRFNNLVRTNPPPFLDVIRLAVKDRLPPKTMVVRCVKGMEMSTLIPPRTIACLLRDIFSFRPITLDPSWLTSTVHALATGIYEERAFDRMPILADALQDAGCDNEDILSHCRQLSMHVRGCFVVDLLLDKK